MSVATGRYCLGIENGKLNGRTYKKYYIQKSWRLFSHTYGEKCQMLQNTLSAGYRSSMLLMELMFILHGKRIFSWFAVDSQNFKTIASIQNTLLKKLIEDRQPEVVRE